MVDHLDIKFSADTEDTKLVELIDTWVRESIPYHDFLLTRQNLSLQYYEGNQTDRGAIPAFRSNTVFNRIFEATETLVPIITGTSHQFVAIPGTHDEQAVKQADKVSQWLGQKYEDLEIQGKLEEVVRDIILKRFGVMEYFWDHDIDDVGVRSIDPRAILIPKHKVAPEQLFYNIKILEFTKRGIEDEFPDFKIEDLSEAKVISTKGTVTPGDDTEEKKYQVLEVWTAETVVWKQGDNILEKKTNPYYDFIGEDQKGKDSDGKKITNKVFFNHLSKPEIPIVFFAPFRTGDGPIASISLAEVGIPIQDDINSQKRSINNNLKRMGNGQVYIDSDALSEEDQNKITDEPGLKIVGIGVASENRVRREAGVPLPSSHFQNLLDSTASFDSVFGVQPSIRGASSAKTLGGQIINREQNLSRIDLLTREVNRGVARLAGGITQLAKMFYTEQRIVKLLGADEGLIFIRFQREDIQDNIVIRTKASETPQLDPVQAGNRAIQLWQLGALDPTSLYQMLGMPNPEKLAQSLLAWKQGQLLQETNARIAEAQAGAQVRNTEGASAGSSRSVETAANSRQRAERGGAANAEKPKGTPKTENN